MIPCSDIRLTTIAENTASTSGLLGEWGLAVLIETPRINVLLDAGPGPSTVHNARAMGIDLGSVDTIVLSHGHHDHTGGLPAVLSEVGRDCIDIVAHPASLEPKYSYRRARNEHRYAGIPYRKEHLESLGARFRLTRDPTFLTEDVAAGGEEPMTTEFESVNPNLRIKQGSKYVQDPMSDDQSLFIRTDRGIVVVLGCAHRGMVNIIRHGLRIMGQDEVYLVLGGTHLGPATDEQVEMTINALDEMGVERIGVSHCTGPKVAARLSSHFGRRFFFNNAGSRVSPPVCADCP